MSETKCVLIPLAEGFEEMEAVCLIDILRRADLTVIVAGLSVGPVTGSHGIQLGTDCTLDDVDADALDAIVLPGGMPGTLGLMQDQRLISLLRALHADGRPTAAICAAPMVLSAAGLVDGVAVTAHPSVRDRLGAAKVVDTSRVVKSGTVWTSQGPGTAIEFALVIVEELRGSQVSQELAEAMLVAS